MYRRLLIMIGLMLLGGCSRIPVPEAPRYLAGDPATVVRMHLLHTTDGGVLPLVKVDVSGEKTWWLLDTGSSHNLITPELAVRHKLKVVGNTLVATIGGRKTGAYHLLPVLKVGTLKLDGQSAGTVDLSGLSAPDGYKVSGILGVPALEKLVVGLDYKNRTVRFATLSTPLQRGMNVIPFKMKGGVPVATISVAGRRGGDFILDTGNATSLVILPSYRLPVAQKGMRFVEVEDIGGTIPTRLASISGLQLGQQQLGPIPVSLPLNNKRYAAVDGSLGNGLLARQPIIFDFPSSQLLLQPQNTAKRPQGTFGFLLARGNIIEIVVNGSPAAKAGLRAGDRIVAANGVNTVQSSAYSIWKVLEGRGSASLEVLRSGEVVSFELGRANYLPLVQ